MKPTLEVFGISRMKLTFHFYANGQKFQKALNENIDTLLGLNAEIMTEGFDIHEKEYRGVIRDDFFEVKSKHKIGVLRTYDPWVLHGDFNQVGSNVELILSTNRTKSLRKTLVPFVVIPLIFIIGILFKLRSIEMEYRVLVGCFLVLITYHLISRWMQFSSMRHFIRSISKNIDFSRIL